MATAASIPASTAASLKAARSAAGIIVLISGRIMRTIISAIGTQANAPEMIVMIDAAAAMIMPVIRQAAKAIGETITTYNPHAAADRAITNSL